MDKKYLLLFNAITDAISALDTLRLCLIAAQQESEEIYLSSEDNG